MAGYFRQPTPDDHANVHSALPTVNQTAKPWLLAATNAGVYVSTHYHPSVIWKRFGAGLPDVWATDLHLRVAPDVIAPVPREGMLTAATYGRSAWEIAVPLTIPPAASVRIRSNEELFFGGGFAENAMAHFTLEFTASAELITPLTYEWTVINGLALSGLSQPSIDVEVPNAGQTVAISVVVTDVDGNTVSDTLEGLAMTSAEVARRQAFCDLINEITRIRKPPNWPVNPLGDALEAPEQCNDWLAAAGTKRIQVPANAGGHHFLFIFNFSFAEITFSDEHARNDYVLGLTSSFLIRRA